MATWAHLGFQDSASNLMEQLILFHDHIMFPLYSASYWILYLPFIYHPYLTHPLMPSYLLHFLSDEFMMMLQ